MPDIGNSQYIGKYQLLRSIGAGEFGEVWLARNPDFGDVAIKVLKGGGDQKRELAAQAPLQHPNIVQIIDAGEDKGRKYIVMRYLPGETMKDALAAGRPFTLHEKVEILYQVCDALHFAHERGVIHRDIKPGNIMLDGVSATVMDFGIASLEGSDDPEGSIHWGTRRYMAPEQLGSPPSLPGRQTDVWSFGVVCFEFLTGQYPFGNGGEAEIIAHIQTKPAYQVRDVFPECSPVLDNLVRNCLEIAPDTRYTTLADSLEELRWERNDLRKAKAARLMIEARDLRSNGKRDEALVIADQALHLATDDRAAALEIKQFRDDLVREKDLEKIPSQVEQLVRDGDRFKETREFRQAIVKYQEAVALNPGNLAVQMKLGDAKRRRDAHRAASADLANAKFEIQREAFPLAYRYVLDAISHDPAHPEAGVLRAELRKRFVESGSAAEWLPAAIGETARAAEDAARRSYALRVLACLREDFASAPEIAKAIDEAVAPLQKPPTPSQNTASAAEADPGSPSSVGVEVEALLRSGKLGDASEMVRYGLECFPGSGELESLAERVRATRHQSRFEEIEKQLRAHLESRRFPQARQLLEDAGTADFGATELWKQLWEEYRNQEKLASSWPPGPRSPIHEMWTRYCAAKDAGDLTGALELVGLMRADAKAPPELEREETAVRAARAERHARAEEIDRGLKAVDERARTGDLAAAVTVAQRLSRRFPSEPAILEQLKRRQNELSARRAGQRRITETIQKAKEMLRSRAAEAVTMLENLDREFACTPQIEEALKAARAQVVRDEEKNAGLDQVRDEVAAKNFGAAMQIMDSLWARFPDRKDVAERRQEIRRICDFEAHDAEERRQLRLAVERSLAAGDPSRAGGIVASARLKHPGWDVEELLALIASAPSRTARPSGESRPSIVPPAAPRPAPPVPRWDAINKGRKEAQRLMARGFYAEAVALLDPLCEQYPDNKDLRQDRNLAKKMMGGPGG